MPVKVRCPKCDKSLNAPDAARGKAIKCPACETKIRVPGDSDGAASGGTARTAVKTRTSTSSAKTAATKKKSAGQDSVDFLSTVDVSKVEDSNVSLCTKCGAQIPEDARECPQCGVDPSTGQLSASAKKRAARKGPDPSLFYKLAWKESLAFTKANMGTVIKLAMLMIADVLLLLGCVFMVVWCSDMPPKVFWAGLGLICYLVLPGLMWGVTVGTVKATVARKNDIRDVPLDLFTNVSLGIKTFVWGTVFLLPLTFLMYPLAMIHMAMPVTKRAWQFWAMLSTFFKNVGPCLFWWMTFIGTNILQAAIGAGIGIFAGASIAALALMAQGGSAPANKAIFWTMNGISLFAALASVFITAFTMLFNARIIGLIAYYFRDTLDLVVVVPEKVYVKKEIPVDKWGNPIKTQQQKVMQAVLAVGLLLLLAGAGFAIWWFAIRKT